MTAAIDLGRVPPGADSLYRKSAFMAHQERFMSQVGPGKWVVQCRVCPRRRGPDDSTDPMWAAYRGGKAVLESAKECHDWWRVHVDSQMHTFMVGPEIRERVRRQDAESRALMTAIFGPSVHK